MSEVKKTNQVRVVLDYPVTVAGVEYADLVVRRPVVRDIRTASNATGSDADQEAMLISQLCGESMDVIDALDYSDYVKLSAALQNFQSPSSSVAR